ncbi:HupE/UreJ family protein [Phaeobacter sp. B1627]|uniref:HupE/UreJ family protein n=1 Tax=Phaeobacter sp. B1627 TaxID=2583809 RepID=UPI00210450F9|nr:HupE/UreJ family protein [Phaeobacter sp. B1627]
MRFFLFSFRRLCAVFRVFAMAFFVAPFGFGISGAQGHELTPTIIDFRVIDAQIAMRIRMNLEAFAAGMDLDAVVNTDSAEQAETYRELRLLAPEDLQPIARNFAADWLPSVRIEAKDSLPLRLQDLELEPVGDPEIPRATILLVSADLPERAQHLTLSWPEGAGGLVLRQHDVENPYTGYLLSGETTPPIAITGGAQLTGWEAFVRYIPVGFDHILPQGLDHILFVLGLFFFSLRLRPLLWQVSAFTLAHTLTLGLATLGWIQVAPTIVEPLIAASITLIALENIFVRKLHPWRPVVVFGFGLLHGLGFASVLGDFGLPVAQFIPALLGFNVGVELGQLTVIAIAYVALGYWFGNHPKYRGRVAIPASATIALIGAYWFVERAFL